MNRYVSTTGSDSAGNGSIVNPWRTINFGVSQLAAGYTLKLRGGIYRETVSVSKSGTAAAPLTIESYTGEIAIIQNTIEAFESVGASAWEADPSAPVGTEVYRSVSTGYSASSDWVGCFAALDTTAVGGERRSRLRRYQDISWIRSTTYTWVSGGNYYGGPGFCVHTDGRIYIRLQNLASPRNAGVPSGAGPNPLGDITSWPAAISGGFNPNSFKVYLAPGISNITVTGSHIDFSRIAIYGGIHGFLFNSGAGNISVSNCRLWMMQHAFANNAVVSNFTISKNHVDTAQSCHFSWAEVHTVGTTYHPHMEGRLWTANGVEISNVVVEQNLVHGVFDLMPAWGATVHDTAIRNNHIIYIIDDMTQANGAHTNHEVGWNYVGGGGLYGYNGGGTAPAASKWVHHNIVDAVFGELGWRLGMENNNGGGSAWRLGGTIFPTHSIDNNCPLKIYNNSFYHTENNANDGSRIERQDLKSLNVPHEVYNNIVWGHNAHSYIRGVTLNAGGPQYLDYNIIYEDGVSQSGSLFRDWNGGNYASLTAWKASADFTASKAIYAPGYEANSKQGNPELASISTGDWRPSPTGIAASGAKALASTGWPGATNAAWFGAVNPNAPNGYGDVGIPLGTLIGPELSPWAGPPQGEPLSVFDDTFDDTFL